MDSSKTDHEEARDPRPGKRRRKWIILLLGVLACVGVLIVWLNLLSGDRKFEVSGDPLGIRLMGVRPDGGDDVFGPEGKSVGPIPDYSDRHSYWDDGAMPRDFIFELPKTDEPIRFLNPVVVYPSGSDYGLYMDYIRVQRSGDGRRLAVLPTTLNRTYRSGKLFTHERIVKRVDLTLRYYLGQRGAAECQFTGPFEMGEEIEDDGDKGCLLSVEKPETNRDAGILKFKVCVNRSAFFSDSLIVYDSDGRWHLGRYAGGSFCSSVSELKYEVRGVVLEKIARITFNEKPREKVFRNIVVEYPDRPRRNHAPYLGKIASRLNIGHLSPEKINTYSFKSPQEAIKCIDVVRGYMITRAWRAIRSPLKPDELDQQQLQRVRTAARSWLNASDPVIRIRGIQLGLWGRWPEFVQPALEVVTTDNTARREAVYALSAYRKHLTPQQIHQIKQLLLTRDDPLTFLSLLRTLTLNREQPAATEALWELARSDKVWLWWPAISSLNTRRAIRKSDRLSDRLRLRIIAGGMPYLVPDAERIAPEAHRLLPGLLSPKFVQMNLSYFSEVFKATVKHVDRKTASAALVRLLRQLLDEWSLHKVEGRSCQNWWAVDRSVKYLNLWHGVNIGGLGSDVSRESASHRSDWKAIAAEAIRWSQTGVDPSKLPAGWRPKADDLRIVWLCEIDPELSVISVWTTPKEKALPTWTSLELADDILGYLISPTADNGPGYLFKLRASIFNVRSHRFERKVRRADLPCNLKIGRYIKGSFSIDKAGKRHPVANWRGQWQVWIESAGNGESVLSDTKLFESWKHQYLAGSPPDKPRPRVFFRHPPKAVEQYVRTQRSQQRREGD